MKRLISFAIVVVMLFSMAFVCNANEVVSVTFSVYDSKNDEYIASPVKSSVVENSSVLSLLLDSVSNVDVIDGAVVSISGIYNSDSTGYKWLYKLNGEIKSVSADLCYLKENDVVEWVYVEVIGSGKDPDVPETTHPTTNIVNTTGQNNNNTHYIPYQT